MKTAVLFVREPEDWKGLEYALCLVRAEGAICNQDGLQRSDAKIKTLFDKTDSRRDKRIQPSRICARGSSRRQERVGEVEKQEAGGSCLGSVISAIQ